VLISELSDCPSLSFSDSTHDHFMRGQVSLLFIGISVAVGLCLCCALRQCLVRRAQRIRAMKQANNSGVSFQSSALVPAASASVSNPIVSVNGGYPAQQAAYNENNQRVAIAQPLLSSSSPHVAAAPTFASLPSRTAYPLAYPVVHVSQPQPSAPPAYNYHRL